MESGREGGGEEGESGNGWGNSESGDRRVGRAETGREGKGGGNGRMRGELQLVHIEHPNRLSESKSTSEHPEGGQDYACNHAVNDCSEETWQSVQAACLL